MKLCKCGCGKKILPPFFYIYYEKIVEKQFCHGHRLSPKLKTIKCEICGKQIKIRFCKSLSHLKHHYCSKKCFGLAKRKRFTTKCATCNKQLIRIIAHQKHSKHHFCNKKCYEIYRLAHPIIGKKHHNWKPKTTKYCIICHKKLLRSPWEKDKYKTCGNSKCISLYASQRFKGPKNWRWKGGITPETQARCNSFEWKLLRKSIYKRDNWTCQRCGVQYKDRNGRPLAVHHLEPWRISKNDNPENLITLCIKCHAIVENHNLIRKIEQVNP